MTGLIAGAILLIVGSAVALVFGWIGSNEALIWTSIAGSVGSAICLALAYYRSKQDTSRPRRRAAPPAAAQTAPATDVSQGTQAMEAIEDEVIVDTVESRFHRPGCPQIGATKEKATRAEARERGLAPCKVCRP